MSRLTRWLGRLLGRRATARPAPAVQESAGSQDATTGLARQVTFTYKPLPQMPQGTWGQVMEREEPVGPVFPYAYEQLETLSRSLELQSRRGIPWGEEGWPL